MPKKSMLASNGVCGSSGSLQVARDEDAGEKHGKLPARALDIEIEVVQSQDRQGKRKRRIYGDAHRHRLARGPKVVADHPVVAAS